MAVDRKQASRPVDPQAVGLALAEAVRDDPVVERLWVTAHRHRVDLWLLTQPVEADGERRLLGFLDGLYDRFPEADVRLHLLNPRFFEELDLELVLPPGSVEIVMSAA